MKLDLPLFSIAVVGCPRTPIEYLAEVVQLEHPANSNMKLPEGQTNAIRAQVWGKSCDMVLKRAQWLRNAVTRAAALKDAEAAVRMRRVECVRRILAPKRTLLMKELLEKAEYPDAKVADEIATGFKLYGWLNPSGVFLPRKPPLLHELLCIGRGLLGSHIEGDRGGYAPWPLRPGLVSRMSWWPPDLR